MTFMAHTVITVVFFLTISFCASSPVKDQSPSPTLSPSDYVPYPSAASYSTASSPSRTATTSGRRVQGESSKEEGAPSFPPPRSGGRQTGRKRLTLFNREELLDDFKKLGIDSTWEPKEIFDKAVHVFAKHHNNRGATRQFNELLVTTGMPDEKMNKLRLMRYRQRKRESSIRDPDVPRMPRAKVPKVWTASEAKAKERGAKLLTEARAIESKEFEEKWSAAHSQYQSPIEAEASVRKQYSYQHYGILLRRKRKAELQGVPSDALPLATVERTQHRDDQSQQLSVPRKKAKVLSSSAIVPLAPSSEAEKPTIPIRSALPSKSRAQQTSSRHVSPSPSDKQGPYGGPRLLAKWTTRKSRSVTPSTMQADKAPKSRGTPAPVRPPQSLRLERFGASIDHPAVESPKPPTRLQLRPVQVSKKQFRGHQSPGASSHGARVRSEDGREQSDALQKSTPSQSERPTVGAKRYRPAERPTVGAKRYRAAEGQTSNSHVSRGQIATITVAGYKRPLPVHAGP